MSYLAYTVKSIPSGARKILYLNWPLVLLIMAVAGIGFLMLYSIPGGSLEPWALPQIKRFAFGLALMFIVAMIPIWFWRNISGLCYFCGILLLITVELLGITSQGAQRWIAIGSFRFQPSEFMKITLIMLLASYYDWLSTHRVSHIVWVLIPVCLITLPAALVLFQPDLGTALLLLLAGSATMFIAGVHWGYFVAVIVSFIALVAAVFQSRGTNWQLLENYQYRRIDTFLDPDSDLLGAGYHITQSKIAFGSGGWTGRGFMQGTQTRLNFLPEKHTDFIFTTLAEEFGFVGTASLLALYVMIIIACIITGLTTRDRFAMILALGIGVTFFLFFSVNMAMVTGRLPVVGVPLPLVSYGGSAMIVLMLAFGLVQSAHIHRPR
ncbi:MAG: rod shape-determining protein RodA [Aestuariivita sp.]|nr:rod shape-determining protein RodA [Aestuariivita sp.]